ncbi:MAG: DUF1684 domain-containing protein [Candidatus Promineifilaceae bacterium]|nr:DUF1684 domain-containing protein [Candidatus Promineifilaceae bacterium]
MNADLADFRAAVDDFMQYHPQSPLDWQQKESFTGLPYFSENEAFVLDVEVERFAVDEPLIEIATNTGDIRPYRRWGRFSFAVDGEQAALVIYSDEHGHELFLPFKDKTNGKESYGAGRYLENHRPGLRHLVGNRLEIDFNYAYNPYCAYNESYSCPLPPAENWLKVPIRAGEKKFELNDNY